MAHVRDGFPPQTNIVRVNGKRASLLTVLKAGNASTLDVISGIKNMLPQIASQTASVAPDAAPGGSIALRARFH